MRSSQIDEFPWCDDFCLLPESREMFLIARYQVVGPGGISTFQKHVVIGVLRYIESPRRYHGVAVVLDKLKKLLPKALANMQFRACQHFGVFLKDSTGNVEARRPGKSQQNNCALQPGGSDGSGNQYIRIDYQTERDHYRFGFREREALMIWSIWREVSVFVRFRTDASPMAFNTSGSGAASLT